MADTSTRIKVPSTGDRDEQKRQQWCDDYLDAVDLRPAHEQQLEAGSGSDSRNTDEP